MTTLVCYHGSNVHTCNDINMVHINSHAKLKHLDIDWASLLHIELLCKHDNIISDACIHYQQTLLLIHMLIIA